MFKRSATNLLTQTKENVKAWLNSFDAVITDCDGVLWIHLNALEGSLEVINLLEAAGKEIYFCTNNSTKSRPELLIKSHTMGYSIEENKIISTANSTAQYLQSLNFKKKVYVIGTESIAKELNAVGIEHYGVGPDSMTMSLAMSNHFKVHENIGAVIVGFDEHFSFSKMAKAASYLNDPDCLFLATNVDERFPTPKVIIPDTGSFVRAVETCSLRKATIIGKPSPVICDHLIKNGSIKPERTLMIGDRCNTDILLGYNCGFQTLLVGSGIHNLSDVDSWKKSNDPELNKLIPDVYLPKLGDLQPFICVLWVYGNPIEGSVEVMNRFKTKKQIFFCTNNSTKTRSELLIKSHAMGYNIGENEVISTANSAAQYLKSLNFQKRVYIIGSEGIAKELDAVGIEHEPVGPDPMPGPLAEYLSSNFELRENVGAVIVGFDEYFSFPKMAKAASYLNEPDCLFIATNTDERFPMPNMVIPGTGSFVRAVETCAERKATVIGKPNTAICDYLIKNGTIKPERTLMIGDRCNTDILLGYNCGFQTLLVGSGIHNLNDVDSWKKSNDPELLKLVPDVFLPKLGDLLQFM